MILSVHAVFGGAIASIVPHQPIMAFSLAFISHLLLDIIPHRDYNLNSVIKTELNRELKLVDGQGQNKKLKRDILIVFLDALLGGVLAIFFFYRYVDIFTLFCSIAGSLLPDFLTFVYLISKQRLGKKFFSFHVQFLHSKIVLKISQTAGIFFQYCTVSVLIFLLLGIRYLFAI